MICFPGFCIVWHPVPSVTHDEQHVVLFLSSFEWITNNDMFSSVIPEISMWVPFTSSIYIYMFRSQHSEESCWPDLFLVYFTSLVPGFLQGRKLIYILGHHIPSILLRITKENHDLVFYYFKVKKFAIKMLFCFKNMYK